jgi:hypothetical protein
MDGSQQIEGRMEMGCGSGGDSAMAGATGVKAARTLPTGAGMTRVRPERIAQVLSCGVIHSCVV